MPLQFLYIFPEGRVFVYQSLHRLNGMNHGTVVSSPEIMTDLLEGISCIFFCKIHHPQSGGEQPDQRYVFHAPSRRLSWTWFVAC